MPDRLHPATPEPPAKTPPVERQRVGWLELFFDLVFVCVIAQVAHLLHGDPSAGLMAGAFGLMTIVWTAWFNEVAFTNISHGATPHASIYVLASMAGVAVMAVGVADAHHGHPMTFALGYALARTALTPVWVRERRHRGLGILRPLLFGPGLALGWVASGLTEHPAPVWAALVVAELTMSVYRPHPGDHSAMAFDAGHMLERIGLFIMLCFGETVGQIVGSLGDEATGAQWLVAGLGFVLVCSLFWMFYDIAMDRVEHALEGAPDRLGDFLGFGQLSIVAGVLGVGAGLADAIEHAAEHLSTGGLRPLAGGVALIGLGVLSLSMEALKAMLITSGHMPDDPSRPVGHGPDLRRQHGVRWAMMAGLTIQVLQATAMPLLVLFFGSGLTPWLVVSLLAVSPLSFAAVGLTRGRGAPRPPGAADAH